LRFLPTPRDRLILEAVRTHGRLTADQIRRLLFIKPHGGLASRQATSARLRRLVDHSYLEPLVVNAGHGTGPYAYGIASQGLAVLGVAAAVRRRTSTRPVWHQLEVAEFRIALQRALQSREGALAEWLGESVLRSLLVGRRGLPVSDALVHWRLPGREGTFLLEWDRGSESLAVLAAKLGRYGGYWRSRGHRALIPGLGLKPRLAVVVRTEERRDRLVRWLLERPAQRPSSTILIGLAERVLRSPLGRSWWRSDTTTTQTLYD
jgi:hypothetical protein